MSALVSPSTCFCALQIVIFPNIRSLIRAHSEASFSVSRAIAWALRIYYLCSFVVRSLSKGTSVRDRNNAERSWRKAKRTRPVYLWCIWTMQSMSQSYSCDWLQFVARVIYQSNALSFTNCWHTNERAAFACTYILYFVMFGTAANAGCCIPVNDSRYVTKFKRK